MGTEDVRWRNMVRDEHLGALCRLVVRFPDPIARVRPSIRERQVSVDDAQSCWCWRKSHVPRRRTSVGHEDSWLIDDGVHHAEHAEFGVHVP